MRPMSGEPASRSIAKAILRTDFYAYVQAIFPTVSPGDTFLRNWHLEAVTHALAQVLRGETKRLIITVPPRSLKSICASVALPAFALGRDPTRRIICASYSENLARKHANDFRAVMRSQIQQEHFPGCRTSSAKDTELEVMTTRRGYRYATSVGGTLTGRGGNLLIIDDPMKPQDAESVLARDNIKDWYSKTLLSRLDSNVGHLLEQGGWTELKLPAIADEEQIVPIGAVRSYHRRQGEVLHPEREPISTLNELKRNMGSLEFVAQYQRSPYRLVATSSSGPGSGFTRTPRDANRTTKSLLAGTPP